MTNLFSRILSRTQLQVIVSPILGLLVFLAEYGTSMLRTFEEGSAVPSGQTQLLLSQHILSFLRQLNEIPKANDIVTGLIWAVAALGLYGIYIMIANIMSAIRNDIIVGTEFSHGSVAKALLTRFSQKIATIIAFILLIALSALILIPYCMELLSIFVFSGLTLYNIPLFIIGISGLIINIYVVWSAAYLTWVYEGSI